MNNYENAKNKLYNVAKLRERLKIYEDEYDKEIRKTAPSGIKPIDWTKPTVSSSRTDDSFDSIEKIAHYKKEILKMQEELKTITAVVDNLADEYKRVIKACYLDREYGERVESWKIANSLHISESSLYRIRKKAIRLFAEIYPW